MSRAARLSRLVSRINFMILFVSLLTLNLVLITFFPLIPVHLQCHHFHCLSLFYLFTLPLKFTFSQIFSIVVISPSPPDCFTDVWPMIQRLDLITCGRLSWLLVILHVLSCRMARLSVTHRSYVKLWNGPRRTAVLRSSFAICTSALAFCAKREKGRKKKLANYDAVKLDFRFFIKQVIY